MSEIKKVKKNLSRTRLVTCSRVFVDKISLTTQAQPIEIEAIERQVRSHPECFKSLNGDINYLNSYRVVIDDIHGFTIQFHARRNPEAKTGFRCEFNLRHSDIHRIAKFLDTRLLPLGYRDLVKRCKITRVDASLDVSERLLDEIIVALPRFKVNRVFSGTGGLERLEYVSTKETEHIGRREGKRSAKLYDKVGEMRRNKTKIPDLTIPKRPTTRIEWTIRDVGTFDDLRFLSNPFALMQVYDMHNLDDTSIEMRSFIDSCMFRGFNNRFMSATSANQHSYNFRYCCN